MRKTGWERQRQESEGEVVELYTGSGARAVGGLGAWQHKDRN
jgi:hypothetical protein